MKLTKRQKALLSRELRAGEYILLLTAGDDTIAKTLSDKGLGYFTSFASSYSWRRRDGYVNHFTPNDAGLALRSAREGAME